MIQYDLIVVGSGPAGRRAAIQAAKLGKKVLVVEQGKRVGGVSVHTGTIPSKTLRETALNLSGWRERGFYGRAYRVKQDISAEDLRRRMAEKREQGREGWETCSVDELGLKLLRSIMDGDPIDVGNYAMMISALNGGTEHVLSMWLAQVLHERHTGLTICREGLQDAAEAAVRAWESETASIGGAMGDLAKVLRR